jgi:hypothetical protein
VSFPPIRTEDTGFNYSCKIGTIPKVIFAIDRRCRVFEPGAFVRIKETRGSPWQHILLNRVDPDGYFHPNPHPEQVEAALKRIDRTGNWFINNNAPLRGIEIHAAAKILEASLANRPADDGELERMRRALAITQLNIPGSVDDQLYIDGWFDGQMYLSMNQKAEAGLPWPMEDPAPPQPEGVKRP